MASIFGGMALIIDFFIEKHRKDAEAELPKTE
jgi:hypothetical protein